MLILQTVLWVESVHCGVFTLLVKMDVTCSEFLGENTDGFDDLFLTQCTPPRKEKSSVQSADSEEETVENSVSFDLDFAASPSVDHDDATVGRLEKRFGPAVSMAELAVNQEKT